MMDTVLNLISTNINYVIFILGIILSALIIRNGYQLGKQKGKIDIILTEKRIKTYISKKTREMNDQEEEGSVTPETLRPYEKEFYKIRSRYDMYTQLISIFPLLGILGTVSGLMSQVVAEDMDALNASLDIALGSTFWGLVFAIFLKPLIVMFPGRIIDEIEIMLDNWFEKYNDAISQKNISE